jgi:hypothetical protein
MGFGPSGVPLMIDRRPIQKQHERANVSSFVNWFNREHHTDFEVDREPKAPDEAPNAVLRSSSGSTCWVEVSTTFWKEAYARDLYSYVTPGETHRPYFHQPVQEPEPDNNFARRFACVVKKKLEKRSYIRCKKMYGHGYLVVPIKYPGFDEQTFQDIKVAWADSASTVKDLGCFTGVYIVSRSNDLIEFPVS